ncbi:MAG: cytochrome c3 family protein [Gammaproteobacteria bacterium]|nr:cytochrome c3 family protein [Gammaproteobacteria bacterium]
MRHRRLALSVIACGALAAAAFFGRQQLVVSGELSAIALDHHDHAAYECVLCHHNFVDETGKSTCYFCHKADRGLALTIEQDFHTLCRDCHVRVAADGRPSGPTRRCASCHLKETQRFNPRRLLEKTVGGGKG